MVNIATATSAYNADIMLEICEKLAESEDGAITKILRSDERYPKKYTFYTSWLAKNEDAREMYQNAVDIWTMRAGERVLEAAYDTDTHYMHNKNRMNGLQWVMERRNRKQWGTKVDLNHGGQKGNPMAALIAEVTGTSLQPVADDEAEEE